MDIVWEEPPATHHRERNSKVKELAKVLQSNPGRWAKIRDYTDNGSVPLDVAQKRAGSGRSNIKSGKTPAWTLDDDDKGAYEAVVRSGVLYARYVTR